MGVEDVRVARWARFSLTSGQAPKGDFPIDSLDAKDAGAAPKKR
jgi:hypothetical protein